MVRTIYVVFVESKVHNTFYKKQYRFLCSNDSVQVGDIIKDPRYTPFMQVVKITPCNARIQEGLTLKDIQIKTLNGRYIQGSDFDIDKQRSNVEIRNIGVTLEQAIEWYNSGFTSLKLLALKAYTKDELELHYNVIEPKVDRAYGCFSIPRSEQKKFRALAKLAIIAKHHNKDWKKTAYNTGYFLGKSCNGNGPIVGALNGVSVYRHNTGQYAGVVYFKNQEDAIKAIKILGNEAKELFG